MVECYEGRHIYSGGESWGWVCQGMEEPDGTRPADVQEATGAGEEGGKRTDCMVCR